MKILKVLILAGVAGALTSGRTLGEEHAPVRSLLEIRHNNVAIQAWDLSCGTAALEILLRYQHGDPVSEKDIARRLMSRPEYLYHPQLIKTRHGFSLLDLKTYVDARGYLGLGLGKLDLPELIAHAPVMVPISALGYNHFVVFRGILAGRVLLADPAWGNRTMTIDKFMDMWVDYGETVGRVGFVVARADGSEPPNRLAPKPSDFVMLR